MLKHRIPSGILMTAGLLLLVWADDALGRRGMPPGLVLLGLILVWGGLASRELATLLRAKWGHCSTASTWASAAAGGLMVFGLPMLETPQTAVAFFGTGVAAVIFVSMFRHSFVRQETQGAAAAGANAAFAMVYLGVLPGMYLLVREAGYSAWVIAAVVMTVKACDIGAYFTGRALGRHKLIPWLSPGKTWEGLVGGMLLSGIAAAGFTLWGNAILDGPALPLWYAAPAGMLLGFLGQIGDLLASLLKRDAGVKDWAATIPGFGGVMDVADSLLLVAPVAYWLLVLAP
ncbi:MAG: phosphatidate cytidylyltransferase [Planctomycetota bacterium]